MQFGHVHGRSQGHKGTKVNPERRCVPRERPEQLSYVHLEPEGGGIVLNASQAGIAFHAAGPVRQRGPIRVRISPNPDVQIDLMAEIAWTDQTKKVGGLRFTEPGEDAQNRIRQWLAGTKESDTQETKSSVPSCATIGETLAGPHSGYETPKLPSPAWTLQDGFPARVRPSPPLPPKLALLEKQGFVSRRHLQRALTIGFLILVFLLLPVWFLRSFRHELGGSLIRIGEKLRGSSDLQPGVSPPLAAKTSRPGLESTPPAPALIPDASAQEASVPATETTTNSADSVQESQHSRQRSASVNSRHTRSILARQLWSALAAGDSSAELPLAQLYLTGEGVPKNCQQARVLFRAAAKNGNIEAQQQLKKLNKSCR